MIDYRWAVLFILMSSMACSAAEPFELPLWPGPAPGSESSSLEETSRDVPVSDGSEATRDLHVSGVRQPTLTVYLPEQGNGAAVVILPGGGFNILAIDKEGHDVARWLNTHGVAGVVVKYRLPDMSAGLYVRNGSLPDVQRAIRLTRSKAAEWNLDPGRIGVSGFSAGGYLTAAAGTIYDEGDGEAADAVSRVSCRPDFMAPIYPLISLPLETDRRAAILERMLGPGFTEQDLRQFSPDHRATSTTPPAFLVHADDDRLSSEHSCLFYLALKRAGVPAELHLYSQGAHGYGIRQRGVPISSWRERWLDWMRVEGFLGGADD